MELDLRDWLLMIGPLFVIGVLLHGYWRMRRNRDQLRMSLDKSFLNAGENVDELSLLKAELPNGGARVINEQRALDLDQEVPLLLEPVADPLSADDVAAAADAISAQLQEEAPVESEPEAEPEPEPEPITAKAPPARKPAPALKPEKFVVFNVLAVDQFDGEALQQAFADQGLEFGEMNIFHSHDSDGHTRFSVVNAVEPGTFDPETMSSIQTPGITIFMRAHEQSDPLQVFADMVTTARNLAEELGGQLCDETRSVATDQTLLHIRQGLEEFQFRHSA